MQDNIRASTRLMTAAAIALVVVAFAAFAWLSGGGVAGAAAGGTTGTGQTHPSSPTIRPRPTATTTAIPAPRRRVAAPAAALTPGLAPASSRPRVSRPPTPSSRPGATARRPLDGQRAGVRARPDVARRRVRRWIRSPRGRDPSGGRPRGRRRASDRRPPGCRWPDTAGRRGHRLRLALDHACPGDVPARREEHLVGDLRGVHSRVRPLHPVRTPPRIPSYPVATCRRCARRRSPAHGGARGSRSDASTR